MLKENKFLAIISLFLFVVCMGSCGGGGGGGGGSSSDIEQTASGILETQNLGQEYYTGLVSQGDPNALQKTVDWLKTQPNVVDAAVGEDSVSIWIKYDSGVEGIILTKSFESLGGTTTSQAKAPKVTILKPNKSSFSISSDKKAIILLPVDSEPTYQDKSADDIASYLQQSGYSVEIYRDEAVTVDLMKTISNYNFAYMATHGGVGFGNVGWNVQIMTGQVANSSTMAIFWNYLKAGATSGLTIFKPSEGDKTYFGLNSNFFDDYTYPGSFIYMNACSSFKNDSLANAFLNNGASVYLGWDNISFLTLGNLHNPQFFQELSKPYNTLKQAYDDTMGKYYPATVFKNDNGNDEYRVLLLSGEDLGDKNDTTINYYLGLKYNGIPEYVLNSTDTTPPSVPTGFTATAVSSSQINLSWNASPESDVAGYKIYDYYGTYLNSVTSTSTSITGLNSNTYYCFSVSTYDAVGNESGQSSQECATTFALSQGTISGSVKDAVTRSPLQDVSINVYSNSSLIATGTTISNGTYYLPSVPSGSGYRVEFTKTGYIPAIYYNVTVAADTTTNLEPVLQIDTTYSGTGNVSGKIVNALDGSGVSGLSIKLREGINVTSGSIVVTTTTWSGGFYEFTNLNAGYYTAEVSGSGYNTTYFTVICIGGMTTANQDATITPILSSGETRIILTWGETPWDLDSHLTGPTPDGNRFHVYWWDKTYSYNGTTYAELDLDDTTSYGPETTTIYQQIGGLYRFSVHDYSNRYSSSSYVLSNSGAQVRVYRGSNLVATFNVPAYQEGTLWTVFEMSGNTITPINTMSYESSSINVQSISLRRSFETDAPLMRNLPLKR